MNQKWTKLIELVKFLSCFRLSWNSCYFLSKHTVKKYPKRRQWQQLVIFNGIPERSWHNFRKKFRIWISRFLWLKMLNSGFQNGFTITGRLRPRKPYMWTRVPLSPTLCPWATGPLCSRYRWICQCGSTARGTVPIFHCCYTVAVVIFSHIWVFNCNIHTLLKECIPSSRNIVFTFLCFHAFLWTKINCKTEMPMQDSWLTDLPDSQYFSWRACWLWWPLPKRPSNDGKNIKYCICVYGYLAPVLYFLNLVHLILETTLPVPYMSALFVRKYGSL